jgi:selenocysteine lyase/cysteine desulfurase
MTYLNTGWSGPNPVSVVEAIKGRLDYEMLQGPTSPEVYQSGREVRTKLREAVAGLLNASPEEVCLTRNTTEGLNIVINGLPWQEGDEIVTCDLEHSSVLVPSYYQQQRHGAVVKVVPVATAESPDVILDKIEAALTGRTRLVFLSHIQYSCGLRMPAKEIRALTRARGILLMLDGAQTAGHIPLDMRDIDCDFYSIAGQKWLLGPQGVGALYIRRDLIPMVQPVHVAGGAALPMDNPYGFQPVESSIDKFSPTSTSVPIQAGLMEAIRFAREVGLAQIEARNLDLAGALKRELQETPGVKVLSPLERRSSSGLVSFAIDGVAPADAVARLWERHRIVVRPVSYPSCVRVSLHYFNTEEEVDQMVGAVGLLAAGR